MNARIITAALIALALVFPATAVAGPTRAEKVAAIARKKRLTKSDVRYIVRVACIERHVPKGKRKWMERAAVDIIFALPGKPAHESNGNAKARNGDYRGIAQMDIDWGSVKRREQPVTAIRMMVRSYKQGGKAKVRQHWAATLGR